MSSIYNGDTHEVRHNHQEIQGNEYRGQGLNTGSTFQGQQARHPEFVERARRLYSYTRWRFSHIQDPTKLANIGFFYTDEGDLVRCFSCSLGLKDFLSTDDPLVEHVRHSAGRCEFLIQLLGPSKLREMKERLKLDGAVGQTASAPREPIPPNKGITHAYHELNIPKNKVQCDVKTHRHPKYGSYSVRVSSYSGWPTHLVQTPQKLAEAGFYYTGTRDVVRCFSCDGGLQRWAPTDDPWIEHCINFSHCNFLKEYKGESYITLALAHHGKPNRLSPPKEESEKEDLTQKVENLRILDQDKKEKEAKQHQTVKMQVVSMGYLQDEVVNAIETLSKGSKEVTIEDILDEIEKKRNGEQLNPKDVLEEHAKLKSQLYCMQCKTEDINTLFLPCQHHRLCSNCSVNITVCPLCGSNIDHKIKTYRP